MTPANRAELRGESEREGRKGARAARGGSKGEARARRGDANAREEGEEDPARASGRSLGPRVPRHGLVSLFGLHGQRSSSSTSHLRVLNLLPRSRRASCRRRRINRIINDRSRPTERLAPRDSTEARNSRRSTLMNFRRVARARAPTRERMEPRGRSRTRPPMSLPNRLTLFRPGMDTGSRGSRVFIRFR